MNVEILDFRRLPSKTKLGNIIVKYEKIVLSCELVYHSGSKKPWIRMPEIWRTRTIKQKFVHWPSAVDSQKFQEIVINKIFDKYDLDVDKIAQMHKDNTYRSSSRKKL